MIERDVNGCAHIVALSGGHDSTILSFLLQEREPRPYNYVCTPTGDELPDMFLFWNWLSSDAGLGKKIIPIMNGTLKSVIKDQNMLPNNRARFCTRILKIKPYREFLKTQVEQGPVISYVGLRYDEEGRAGGAFSDIDGVTMRFPLREWQMDESAVQAGLAERGIAVPERTDCARCYHQTLGEWWKLWYNYPEIYADAEEQEQHHGHTFRNKTRDTWPASLRQLRLLFEEGRVPTRRGDPRQRDLLTSGSCRVCSM